MAVKDETTKKEIYRAFIDLLGGETFGWGEELAGDEKNLDQLIYQGVMVNKDGSMPTALIGRLEEQRRDDIAKRFGSGKPVYIYRKGEEYPREVTYDLESKSFKVSKTIDKLKDEIPKVEKPSWFKRYYLNLFSLLFRFRSLDSVREWKHYENQKKAIERAMDPKRLKKHRKIDPILSKGGHAKELDIDKINQKNEPEKEKTPENKVISDLTTKLEELTKQFAELQKELKVLKNPNAAVEEPQAEQKQNDQPEVKAEQPVAENPAVGQVQPAVQQPAVQDQPQNTTIQPPFPIQQEYEANEAQPQEGSKENPLQGVKDDSVREETPAPKEKSMTEKMMDLMGSDVFGWKDVNRYGELQLDEYLQKGLLRGSRGEILVGEDAELTDEQREKVIADAFKDGKRAYLYRQGEETPREISYDPKTGQFSYSKPIDKLGDPEPPKKPSLFSRIANPLSKLFRGKDIESVGKWDAHENRQFAFAKLKSSGTVNSRNENDPMLQKGMKAEPLETDKYDQITEEQLKQLNEDITKIDYVPPKKEEQPVDLDMDPKDIEMIEKMKLDAQVAKLRAERIGKENEPIIGEKDLDNAKEDIKKINQLLNENEEEPIEGEKELSQEERETQLEAEKTLENIITKIPQIEKKDVKQKDNETVKLTDGDQLDPNQLDGKEAEVLAEEKKDFFQKGEREEPKEQEKDIDSVMEKNDPVDEKKDPDKEEPTDKSEEERKKQEEFAAKKEEEPEQPQQDVKNVCDRLIDQLKKSEKTQVTEKMENNIRTLYDNAEKAKISLANSCEKGAFFAGGLEIKQLVAFNSVKKQIESGSMPPKTAAILGFDKGAEFLTAGAGLSAEMKFAATTGLPPAFFKKNFLDQNGLDKMTEKSENALTTSVLDKGSERDIEHSLERPGKVKTTKKQEVKQEKKTVSVGPGMKG